MPTWPKVFSTPLPFSLPLATNALGAGLAADKHGEPGLGGIPIELLLAGWVGGFQFGNGGVGQSDFQ